MRILIDEDASFLQDVFENNTDYDKRTRSHIALLFNQNFGIGTISHIYNTRYEHVNYLIYFIVYFGIKDYLSIDFSVLCERVNHENYRLEKEKIWLEKQRAFYYLLWPFKTLYIFIKEAGSVFIAFLAYVISLFIKPKKLRGDKITHNVSIGLGSSNNKIMQIGKLEININGMPLNKIKESIVTDSTETLIDKVEEIINSEEFYTFGNKAADKLYTRSKEIHKNNQIPIDEKKSKIKLYASLIVSLLLYSSTFKGGVSTISFFGIVIAVSLKGCYNNSPGNLLNTLSFKPETSNSIQNNKIDTINNSYMEIDTTLSGSIPHIYNYTDYKRHVWKYYEQDNNCFLLCAMGSIQKIFIEEIDQIEHSGQSYFITESDNLYYIHVVAYKKPSEAVFQMHYIRANTEFKDAKVLEVITEKGLLYAVVIGKFKGSDSSLMCELIDKWKSKCLSDQVDIGCYYNG